MIKLDATLPNLQWFIDLHRKEIYLDMELSRIFIAYDTALLRKYEQEMEEIMQIETGDRLRVLSTNSVKEFLLSYLKIPKEMFANDDPKKTKSENANVVSLRKENLKSILESEYNCKFVELYKEYSSLKSSLSTFENAYNNGKPTSKLSSRGVPYVIVSYNLKEQQNKRVQTDDPNVQAFNHRYSNAIVAKGGYLFHDIDFRQFEASIGFDFLLKDRENREFVYRSNDVYGAMFDITMPDSSYLWTKEFRGRYKSVYLQASYGQSKHATQQVIRNKEATNALYDYFEASEGRSKYLDRATKLAQSGNIVTVTGLCGTKVYLDPSRYKGGSAIEILNYLKNAPMQLSGHEILVKQAKVLFDACHAKGIMIELDMSRHDQLVISFPENKYAEYVEIYLENSIIGKDGMRPLRTEGFVSRVFKASNSWVHEHVELSSPELTEEELQEILLKPVPDYNPFKDSIEIEMSHTYFQGNSDTVYKVVCGKCVERESKHVQTTKAIYGAVSATEDIATIYSSVITQIVRDNQSVDFEISSDIPHAFFMEKALALSKSMDLGIEFKFKDFSSILRPEHVLSTIMLRVCDKNPAVMEDLKDVNLTRIEYVIRGVKVA